MTQWFFETNRSRARCLFYIRPGGCCLSRFLDNSPSPTLPPSPPCLIQVDRHSSLKSTRYTASIRTTKRHYYLSLTMITITWRAQLLCVKDSPFRKRKFPFELITSGGLNESTPARFARENRIKLSVRTVSAPRTHFEQATEPTASRGSPIHPMQPVLGPV